MTHDRLLLLMQLGDSALPSGGYAFSNGLEAAYQTGVVTDVTSFESCLLDGLHQLRMGELPFIHSCFEPETLDESAFVDLMAEYDATQLVPAIRKSSEVLGRNWIRLIAELEGAEAVEKIMMWLTRAELPAHLTPLFAATMRASATTEEEAKLLFVHQFVRDQISAAVRLGMCGPMAAARIHRRVMPACAGLVSDALTYDKASRWMPRWDIAQCDHDHLYTRLFQN